MPAAKQQDLLAALALRSWAPAPDEWTLLLANSSQYTLHAKPVTVYGNTERILPTHGADDVLRSVLRGHERSEHVCGSVQHIQELTDTTRRLHSDTVVHYGVVFDVSGHN